MPVGIRTIYNVATNQAFASNVTLATVGLTAPVAAGQRLKIRAWVCFSTGATGGVRFQLKTPAAPTSFLQSSVIYDTVTPAVIAAVATSSAPVTNALANAGTYFVEVEATVVNGTTAGTLDLQFAQNTAANTTTILAQSTMEVTTW